MVWDVSTWISGLQRRLWQRLFDRLGSFREFNRCSTIAEVATSVGRASRRPAASEMAHSTHVVAMLAVGHFPCRRVSRRTARCPESFCILQSNCHQGLIGLIGPMDCIIERLCERAVHPHKMGFGKRMPDTGPIDYLTSLSSAWIRSWKSTRYRDLHSTKSIIAQGRLL
jgi:hypothetical protein